MASHKRWYKGQARTRYLRRGFSQFISSDRISSTREPRKEPKFSYRLLRRRSIRVSLIVHNQVIRADDLGRAMVGAGRKPKKWQLGAGFRNVTSRAMVDSLDLTA